MVFLVGTSDTFRCPRIFIYAANGVDGFNGIPKGSEAATWNQKAAGCKSSNRHFVVLVKINFLTSKIFSTGTPKGAKH
jgi:hypothetical protein